MSTLRIGVERFGDVVPHHRKFHGNVMNLSFSFDHRILDGAVGADFAQRVIKYLENPELLLLEA